MTVHVTSLSVARFRSSSRSPAAYCFLLPDLSETHFRDNIFVDMDHDEE
jgi:hypothetical protein